MKCDRDTQGFLRSRPCRMQDSPPSTSYSSRTMRNRADDIAVPRASPASFPILTSDLPGGYKQHDPNQFYSYPRVTMDPLTLTTSVITIVGAAIAITKAVDNLSTALRDAKDDLTSLNNEISDLRVVLDGVSAVIKEWTSGRIAVPMNDMGLTHILSELEADTKKLNNLILSCLINPHSTNAVKPNRLKWYYEKKAIKTVQANIRARKLDLATAINTCNMSGIAKLHVSIHQISVGVENIQAEQRRGKVTPLLEAPPAGTSKVSTGVDVENDEFLDTTEYIQSPTANHQPFPETPGEMLAVVQHAENIKVEATFSKKNACRVLCSCRCHKKGSFRTPAFTKNFIGSLFVGYSCLPFVAAKCNEKKCRQRETKVVVAYQFPKWFWAQQLFKASISAGAPSGPELLLRVQRVFPWSSEIYQYCLDGNVSGLKRLFEDRIISPFDVDPQGRSLIHNALRGKNTAAATELFLAAGADMRQEDQFGHSAIHAVWDQVFLASPKDTEKRKLIEFVKGDGGLDNRNFTRVHKIVLGILLSPTLRDDLEVSTVDIDVGDSVGRTPLFWAASRGDVEAVSILLEYGADPNVICPSGGPLTMAAKHGHGEVTRLLLQHGAEVDGRCHQFRTPLMEAATLIDSNPCIPYLIEAGANINAQDCHFESAALEAAMCGKLQNLRVLLDAGADMNLPEQDGWCPLACCIFWMERDTAPCIKELIARGADVTMKVNWGETILHNAAQYAGIPTLKALTEGKLTQLDPEALSHAGMTPRDVAERRTDVNEEWWEHFEALLQSVIPEAEPETPITERASTTVVLDDTNPIRSTTKSTTATTISVTEVGPDSRHSSISSESAGEPQVEYVETVTKLQVEVFYEKPVKVNDIKLEFGGGKHLRNYAGDEEESSEDEFTDAVEEVRAVGVAV